jgi:hypothetical protein
MIEPPGEAIGSSPSASLAGTRHVPDMVVQLEHGQPPGQAAAMMRLSRGWTPTTCGAYAPAGEAANLEGGRVKHVRIIRTTPGETTLQQVCAWSQQPTTVATRSRQPRSRAQVRLPASSERGDVTSRERPDTDLLG